MHRLKTWDWGSWKLNGDILAQAENMRLRFMKVKLWHSCTGWKPGAWVSWKWNSEVLAQDENQGPEFHEHEILKFLRRMKTWGLSFMSATLGYQELQAKVFIGCSLYLTHHFNWRILARTGGWKPGCLITWMPKRGSFGAPVEASKAAWSCPLERASSTKAALPDVTFWRL